MGFDVEEGAVHALEARVAKEALSVEALFVAYRSYVATIALRVLGDAQAADDVVQETFLSAHRHLSSLRDPEAAKGWLARIAIRHARATLRRRRLRQFVGLSVLADYYAVAPGATAEDKALLVRIYTHLETLPANQRIAWTLRYVEGEKLQSVAELSDCSLATVKRRIASADASIRALLNLEDDDER